MSQTNIILCILHSSIEGWDVECYLIFRFRFYCGKHNWPMNIFKETLRNRNEANTNHFIVNYKINGNYAWWISSKPTPFTKAYKWHKNEKKLLLKCNRFIGNQWNLKMINQEKIFQRASSKSGFLEVKQETFRLHTLKTFFLISSYFHLKRFLRKMLHFNEMRIFASRIMCCE